MSKRIACLIISTLIFLSTGAQENRILQETFLDAEYFFLNEDYIDALPSYLSLYEKLPGSANLSYRIGKCYLNIPGKKNLSVSYLETASKNMSARHKEGSVNQMTAPYDVLYDLGTAYRINFQFDKARDTFLKYRDILPPDDKENIDFIDQQIKVCETAKELTAKPVAYTEENLGEIFNDEKSNSNPLISADGKSFVTMVSLKFYNAVMFSRFVKGKWSTLLNITPDLQTDGDIFVSCLAADGNTLYLSEDDDFNSDIFYSTYDGDKWAKAIKLNKNINTKYWESHGFVSEDGSRLIFASDRPGGFGGLDLYISYKNKSGDWGVPVNLGIEINTPYNEDRPFLINDGKTLFFCSQGHYNMGGYDLFRSEFQSNGLWSEPQNMGYPFNTPDDDTFFMPADKGKSGYISIFKESGGFGREDIYKITFK